MREPRNPFRLRASEHIESDATFVRLFGPGVLELLPPEEGLGNVRIIRSAPGGGKTSLMRLFTPGSLLTLHAYRTRDDCKELYQRMRDLGALADAGPQVLGVMLSCARNYSALADMDLEPGRQMRLLFALLDARIVLAVLRGALALSRLRYPEDLERLVLTGGAAPPGLALPCNGRVVYDWASKLEAEICDAIDSFDSAEAAASGHEILLSPAMLSPGSITVDDRPVADKLLVMLDDLEKLTSLQRDHLVKTVLAMRSATGIWMAERMEALGTDEMLASGTSEGRDYQFAVLLEDYWREGGRQKRFENLVLNIADRRAHEAAGVDVDSFGGALQSSLDGPEWEPTFQKAGEIVAARVRERAAGRALFKDWVSERESTGGTPREIATAWRTLEILIERESRKAQQSFDFTLNVEALEKKDDSSLKAAAELFLAEEFSIPYYFGPSALAKLASSNIEQFLWLASEEFEEIASASIINRENLADLTAVRQEAILRAAATSLWDQIPRRAKYGRRLRNFLEAIGEFSRSYTQRPSAPNDPGVNGIAISMRDREKLLDPQYLKQNPKHAELAELLASALAQNLLDATLDYKVKGEKWMVLNLNRLLCVRYRLPLHYGKFKEKTLVELSRWVEDGFKPPRGEAELL